MGKRKAKKKSNSVNKTNSYLSRYQVKFARRRAGALIFRLCFFTPKTKRERAWGRRKNADRSLTRGMVRERRESPGNELDAFLDVFFAEFGRFIAKCAFASAFAGGFFERARAFFFLLSPVWVPQTPIFLSRVCKRLVLTLSISILLHRNHQQVKPITKLAARSSPRTRTSTTPQSTDLSSDSRTDALFAKLSTPPSRVM